ncbi:YdaU family protein [Acinetobacter sp. NyZ410]|uniref:YdaU family protein n=1 Tax=Acinetobacter sp. NyZ410 TaxID=2929509 RepID=UPI001FB96D96|nr:YdaU family protein [Acinetobacter sp. NyZ410]UOH16929.1 YdaU family protein [Acinetobacter sp. NyZ410]
MHYYERNIGDYHRKAGRLNILQHGVYNLLIDSCYDRERFPTLEEAIDWVWAESEEEIEAVKFVLKKFFQLNEGGQYVQTHIEEDLNHYKGFLSKQSENGKKGGRPKGSGRRNTPNNGNILDNRSLNNESQDNPTETQNNPEKPKESHLKPKPINHRTNKPKNQESAQKSENQENSLDQVLKVWTPDVKQLNDWLKQSGLMPMTPELINQILPEINAYYQTKLESGSIRSNQMYSNFVKWVKRDPRLYIQTPDDQPAEEQDLIPPPEIKPIPVKYGQGLGGGK